jgi:hypothetical protein
VVECVDSGGRIDLPCLTLACISDLIVADPQEAGRVAVELEGIAVLVERSLKGLGIGYQRSSTSRSTAIPDDEEKRKG